MPEAVHFQYSSYWERRRNFSAKEQLTVNRWNTSACYFLPSFSSPSFVASP